jgi:uroporphyrin-III C-methyltransferase
MALAVRTPRFQPLPASFFATSTTASFSATSTTASFPAVRTAGPGAGAVRASAASPFTEATSSSRYRRDAWSYAADGNPSSCDAAAAAAASGRRDDEITLQLPELRRLLDALRAKGAEGECGSGGGPGRVALVGTGPGDPELLTLKAVRAIQSADLVLYDRLVSNDVMDLVGEGAMLLYVGKTAGYHSRTQVRNTSVYL